MKDSFTWRPCTPVAAENCSWSLVSLAFVMGVSSSFELMVPLTSWNR
jgi:hypothetical protein